MDETLVIVFVMALGLVGANGMLVAFSVPLVRRRVPPNGLYGVRTRKTLRDADVWYPANAYGGKALIVSSTISTVLVLGLVGLAALMPADTRADYKVLFLVLMMAGFVVPALAAAGASLVYGRRL